MHGMVGRLTINLSPGTINWQYEALKLLDSTVNDRYPRIWARYSHSHESSSTSNFPFECAAKDLKIHEQKGRQVTEEGHYGYQKAYGQEAQNQPTPDGMC